MWVVALALHRLGQVGEDMDGIGEEAGLEHSSDTLIDLAPHPELQGV